MKWIARIAMSAAVAATAMLTTAPPAAAVVRGKPMPAIALYGEPKYGPDFKGADFINPDAPKGGTLVMSNMNDQTFDTFSPFTLKGSPAQRVGLMFDTLMVQGEDEPFTNYCLLCESVEVANDNSWVQFKLRPEAKFSDGSPVTADDAVFSFNILRAPGSAPFYQIYWQDIAKAEAVDPHTVRFTFKTKDNRELALIIGQLPVLSKAYWSKRDFSATTLDIPVSNGPYTIESFEVGRYILYKRLPNYWGRNLPVNRGRYNFDHLRFEYFRDQTASFEAFKAGTYDIYKENIARQWTTAYDFPAVKDGRVIKLEVPDASPMSGQGFTFNLRRPMFQDRRVREAFNLAFDFESLNKTIFYGQYVRERSYWQRSDLEAKGPPTQAELALLEPFKDKLPPELFTQEFKQPTTDGTGNARANLLKARDLLTAAGWVLKDGQLMKDGKPLTFELLDVQQGTETVITPWLQNLQRLGIKGTIRFIDFSQYVNRLNDFDFDVVILPTMNSLSPGNEQPLMWGSAAADQHGSQNYVGVKDPAVDAIIEKILTAPDRESLVTATHALDRVLTWNYYKVLHYGAPKDWYAHWAKLKHPAKFPLQALGPLGDGIIEEWWVDPAAAKAEAPH